MVWHPMSLHNLAFLLPSQRVDDRTQLPACCPKINFRRRLGTKTTWYLQSHLEWGEALIKL